jgi:hypothetical protein
VKPIEPGCLAIVINLFGDDADMNGKVVKVVDFVGKPDINRYGIDAMQWLVLPDEYWEINWNGATGVIREKYLMRIDDDGELKKKQEEGDKHDDIWTYAEWSEK